MQISNEEIKEDIRNLKSRLATARKKLKALPTGYIPYPAHKQRERQRYRLLDEIENLKKILKIAQEGLKDYKQELPKNLNPSKEKPKTPSRQISLF